VLDGEGAGAVSPRALIAGQDVELDERGRWHILREVTKGRVVSVVDPEARHVHTSRSTTATAPRRTWRSNPRPD
jgi:hypothetical protein